LKERARSPQRAQIHTLEGFAAAFVIIFAILFGLQAAAISSSGTLDQEVTKYDKKLTNDVVLQSKASGELDDTLLNWTSTDGFNGSDDATYYTGNASSVPGKFADTLGILDREGLTYNIDLVCDGTRNRFVRNGHGGDNPVSSSVSVTLNDDDTLADGTRLENALSYPCEDTSANSNLYNVVEVSITAWRG